MPQCKSSRLEGALFVHHGGGGGLQGRTRAFREKDQQLESYEWNKTQNKSGKKKKGNEYLHHIAEDLHIHHNKEPDVSGAISTIKSAEYVREILKGHRTSHAMHACQ